MKRVVLMVADGLGVGALPDAAQYGDDGANTLAHTASFVGGLKLSTLQRLGIGNIGDFPGMAPNGSPEGWTGRLAEKSAGKDTTTGHWEIAGLVTTKPFALFPEGFPSEILEPFIRESQIPGILGNKAASGTKIIEELGEEHLKTLKPIIYTSGDSVFQIAAHEKVFELERLYRICEIARRITLPHQIGRVIARPFVGSAKEDFKRTENRRDYVLSPGVNLLDILSDHSITVYSVGKIEDIFDHRGITFGNHTGNNADSLKATLDFLKKSRSEKSLIFTNLVDFDMLYGHRRDPKGYARALSEMDAFLPKLLAELTSEDCLIITGDHGCDPTYRGTDHTREFVPVVYAQPGHGGGQLGDRASFSDIASTLLEGFGIAADRLPTEGKSFLCKLRK